MYRKNLDTFIRKLPGITAKDLKSRTSYWRADGTRFCKLEESGSSTVIVFTDMLFEKDGHQLQNSEPDHEGRLQIRLTNSQRVEDAKELIAKRMVNAPTSDHTNTL
jgi:hypothetical protein